MHEQGQPSYRKRVQELNVANLDMLPSGPQPGSGSRPGSTRNSQHQRVHSQERQLHDFIQATKAQAMQQRRKKANIFTNKRGNNAAEGNENWVLSDMGSDNVSVGGDSHSSYSSMHRPRFGAQAALMKHNK